MIRHINNLESVLTYEGTVEMHTLIVGQAITRQPVPATASAMSIRLLVNGVMMDYFVLTAADMPPIELLRTEVQSPVML